MSSTARTILLSIGLIAVAPFALAHCGSDGATGGSDGGGGGDGDDDGGLSDRDIEALCNDYEVAVCDYVSDCYGLDEDDCLEAGERACEDAIDADADEVERCVTGLDEAECTDSLPRACKEAVTFPEGEGGGIGSGSGGGDGDGDGTGGYYGGDGDGTGGYYGGDGDGDGDGTCTLEVVFDASLCDVDCDQNITNTDTGSVMCTITCDTDVDCGDGSMVCAEDGQGNSACLYDCSGDDACPSAFVCDQDALLCLPD